MALIYFQLGREDHRWWWRSFFSGGSTGLFVYAYSFFYFFNTSDMNGLLQVCGVRIGLVWVGLGWAGLGWAGESEELYCQAVVEERDPVCVVRCRWV